MHMAMVLGLGLLLLLSLLPRHRRHQPGQGQRQHLGLNPNASVISLIHRDDPSVCSPFNTSVKAAQLPWGKKDCQDFNRIFGELKAEYKNIAKNGATPVNFFRPVSQGLGSGAFITVTVTL